MRFSLGQSASQSVADHERLREASRLVRGRGRVRVLPLRLVGGGAEVVLPHREARHDGHVVRGELGNGRA